MDSSSRRSSIAGLGVPCIIVALGCVVLLSPDLVGAKSGGPKTIIVNCTRGESINAALADNAPQLVVQFSGTCAEDVTISRDDVTLEGLDSSATIVGAGLGPPPAYPLPGMPPGVDVAGASRVTLQNFTVTDPDSAGVRVRAGGSVSLEHMQLVGNAKSGLLVYEGSVARVADSSASDNTGDGIGAWESSSVTIHGAVTASGNGRIGVIVSTGSSVTQDRGDPLIVNDNQTGLFAQLEGSFQILSPEVKNNSWTGISIVGGSYSGGGVIQGNSIGVMLEQAGFLVLRDATVSGNRGGVDLMAGETYLENVVVTGNTRWGLGLEAGFAYLVDVTVENNGPDAELALGFGAKVLFDGTNTIEDIRCDSSVLVQGTPQCPPAATVKERSSSNRVAGRSVMEPARERSRLQRLDP